MFSVFRCQKTHNGGAKQEPVITIESFQSDCGVKDVRNQASRGGPRHAADVSPHFGFLSMPGCGAANRAGILAAAHLTA